MHLKEREGVALWPLMVMIVDGCYLMLVSIKLVTK
jgi:hypothetical protein